jgi:hypothetical protein
MLIKFNHMFNIPHIGVSFVLILQELDCYNSPHIRIFFGWKDIIFKHINHHVSLSKHINLYFNLGLQINNINNV